MSHQEANMAVPSASRFVSCDESIKILNDPIEENFAIYDIGSGLDTDDDFSSHKQSVSSESEKGEQSDTGDESEESDLHVKRPRVQSTWNWTKVDDEYVGEKYHFQVRKGHYNK
jgi:hypothetical protein